MNQPTMDINTLGRRLDRLERENRWWRIFGSVSVVVLGLLLLMGATRSQKGDIPDEIQAKRFVVMDQAGKLRAKLASGVDGTTSLVFFDQDERLRATLAVGANGTTGMGFVDQSGKRRVTLAVAGDGTIGLGFSDQAEKPRAIVAVKSNGTPTLVLHDQFGKVIWSAP
ncbi:MAG: hypothetical protein HY731_15635 [Candidatus Tectomicrobia bacterium]|nr:hypothetical protein [Candidatus Tectomicrobia bacterium]